MCPEDQNNQNAAQDPTIKGALEGAEKSTAERVSALEEEHGQMKAVFDSIATLDQRLTELEKRVMSQPEAVEGEATVSSGNATVDELLARVHALETAFARRAGGG